MKDIGMLYKPDMITAILELRKTVTRRIIIPQPISFGCSGHPLKDHSTVMYPNRKKVIECPYGKPGDRHYIKEPHYLFGQWATDGVQKKDRGKWKWRFFYNRDKGVMFPDNPPDEICPPKTRGSTIGPGWFKRSPLFMPKWAARHWMLVKDIRPEQVQDITRADCFAEGIGVPNSCEAMEDWEIKGLFGELWDSINEKRGFGWDTNCWAWRIASALIGGDDAVSSG